MRIRLPDGSVVEDVHVENGQVRGFHVLPNGRRLHFTATPEAWDVASGAKARREADEESRRFREANEAQRGVDMAFNVAIFHA